MAFTIQRKGPNQWSVFDGETEHYQGLTKGEASATAREMNAAVPDVEMPVKGRTFTYIGDPKNDFAGPDETYFRGQLFKKGEETLVEDESMYPKLEWCTHFK